MKLFFPNFVEGEYNERSLEAVSKNKYKCCCIAFRRKKVLDPMDG